MGSGSRVPKSTHAEVWKLALWNPMFKSTGFVSRDYCISDDLLEKTCVYKWTHAVQTHVVHESTVQYLRIRGYRRLTLCICGFCGADCRLEDAWNLEYKGLGTSPSCILKYDCIFLNSWKGICTAFPTQRNVKSLRW